MPRYVTRAERPLYIETPLWPDDRKSHCPALDVDGAKQVDTGLVDANGKTIMRLQDPIGFGRG